jgi:hypothetical protein
MTTLWTNGIVLTLLAGLDSNESRSAQRES